MAELAVAAVKGTEVEAQIAAEARLASVPQVAVTLARMIDLAARESRQCE